MRSICNAVLALLALVACGSPTFRVLHHRQDLAAARAEEFARVAFVERDAGRAYALLWDEGKKRVSSDSVAAGIMKMHPKGYPVQIKAMEYEPIFGQPAMNIFLDGSGADEEFHYRLILQGTAETNYRVSDFFRGSGPYPPSPNRKPL